MAENLFISNDSKKQALLISNDSKKQTLIIFTDGGARGNPGPAAIGFVVKDSQGKILVKFGKYIGRATNNVAEYQAVVEALGWLEKNYSPAELTQWRINFYLDSKLVANQLSGKYKIKDLKLKKLIVEVKELEKKISSKIVYYFISREKNYHADLLVNQVLNGKNY